MNTTTPATPADDTIGPAIVPTPTVDREQRKAELREALGRAFAASREAPPQVPTGANRAMRRGAR